MSDQQYSLLVLAVVLTFLAGLIAYIRQDVDDPDNDDG